MTTQLILKRLVLPKDATGLHPVSWLGGCAHVQILASEASNPVFEADHAGFD